MIPSVLESQGHTAGSGLIVGIGASAGGLEALERFFAHVSPSSGLAYVVVQHLDPDHGSLLPELLGRCCRIPVQTIEHGTRAEPDHVYVIPPNTELTLVDGALQLRAPQAPRGHRFPINVFFQSLAEDQGRHAAGVILSGTGSDGTQGLLAIREAGGLALVQEPSSARHDGMPVSAVKAGYVDAVLPVEEMPPRLVAHARALAAAEGEGPAEETPRYGAPGDLVGAICTILCDRTGHDFHHYKRNTLVRRIQRRLDARRVDTLEAYLEILRRDPEEPRLLVKDLLIGVTHFFRDPEAYEALAREVIPRLFEKPGLDPIRVWVAGCATGEEAYSIAILLCEHMDRTGDARPAHVFATDVDASALDVARRGSFGESIAQQVSPARLDRFFVPRGATYQVAAEVREMCIFSTHDLVHDPPFSRIDLLTCRNVLIYFEGALQRKLLPVLHYALRPGGYLFLGPSENVAGRSELFEAIDAKNRIFQRRPVSLVRPAELKLQSPPTRPAPRRPLPSPEPARKDVGDLFQRALLQDFVPPSLLLNDRGRILHVAGRTGRILSVPQGPFENDVFDMIRRELRFELRAALQKAVRTGATVTSEARIEATEGDAAVPLHITVRPLGASDGEPQLFMAVFEERPPAAAPIEAAPGATQESKDLVLSELWAELGRTRRDLEATIEALETSNEEQKSANEELLSMNEELEAANEELSSSKEELQSMNEELQTVNAELSRKLEELDRANDDLSNLFQSTQIATIFLDARLCIKRFTPAATELFRLIPSDIGRPIADIAGPPSMAGWLDDAHTVLHTLAPQERQIRVPEHHAWYILRVLPYRSSSTNAVDGVVVAFLDVTQIKRVERRAQELAAIVASSRDAIVTFDEGRIIRSWNRGAELLYGFSAEEAVGKHVSLFVPPDRMDEFVNLERRARAGSLEDHIDTRRLRKQGPPVDVSVTFSPVLDEEGKMVGLSSIARDISRRKQAEDDRLRLSRELERGVAELSTVLDVVPIGIAVAHDPDCKLITGNPACARILGVPPTENISKTGAFAERLPFRVFRDGKEIPGAELPMQRAAARGEEVRGELCELLFEGGTRRDLVISAVPLFDEEGRPRGAAASLLDVTAERRAESELLRAARHKDEFLALLGHELRNPLAAITTAVEVMKRKGASAWGVDRPMQILERQLGHITRLVDDLLDVARVSRGKIELKEDALDFVALVRAVIEDHRAAAQARGITLVWESAAGELPLQGDGVRLAQVVGNLLSNALKFTPRGGRVTVSLTAEGSRACLSVTDTGAGMEASLLERIFEPFEQGPSTIDRSQGGLGLGLSLSRTLVEMHGGSIEAQSPGKGHGSTFVVHLPLSNQPAPRPSPGPSAPVEAQPRRVLIIEDSEDICASLVEFVQGLGHEVEVARSGVAGLSAAHRFHPQVILCDIGLPGGLDGYAVAREVRADPLLRTVRLVALTGYGRKEDVEEARAAGFDLHMRKPPDLGRLERILREGRG